MQEHNRKITGPYSWASAVLPHSASMGKILVGCMAALAAYAGVTDGLELSAAGQALYIAGRYRDAETTYRRALVEFDAGFDAASGSEKSLSRAVTVENLGAALRALGRFAEARPLLEES